MEWSGAFRPILLSLLAEVTLTAIAQGVGAATCSTAPPTVPAGQLRARGVAVDVPGGTYAPTIAGAPAFYALDGGTINTSGPVALITTATNTATACTANAGVINFRAAGSTVSRLSAGGPSLRAEAGTASSSAGTRFYTSSANSDGLQLVGASFNGSNDLIVTGVTLGTSATNPTTYGLPVDGSGNLVTDPSQYLGKAATAAHGVNANGANVRLNVDGAGHALGGTTSIYVLGTGASAANGSDGIHATGAAGIAIDRVHITTRGNNNVGIRLADASQLTATNLLVDAGGTAAHGVYASDGSRGDVTDLDVRVAGQNAYGILAASGSLLNLAGSGSVVIAAGQTGNGLRADGAGSAVAANGLRISTLRNGGAGANAINGGSIDIGASTVYSSGIAGGNQAVGLIAGAAGTVVSRGNTIVTGILLGTDPTLASYGLPVDGGGNIVSDPASYVPTGTTGANGAQVVGTGGTLRVDVDGNGTALGSSTVITTYGNNSSGIGVAQAAGASTFLQAANSAITTYGVNSNGVLVQGTAGSSGPQATLSGLSVRTVALNANDIYGQAGAQIGVTDSFLATSGGAAAIRSDGSSTRVVARGIVTGSGGAGGPGLNATGGTIDSADSLIINAGRPAMTLNAGGGTAGTLISNGDTVYTGVLLGTNLSQPTFGKPVDANGNLVTDASQFVASGLSGHGVFAGTANGRVWMNVDPVSGAPTGLRSSITTLGDISEGLNIAGENALASLANVAISTRGVDSIGARASTAGEIRGFGLDITTSGQHGYGLAAYANSQVTATATGITTTGPQAHGLIAWSADSHIAFSGSGSVRTSGTLAHGALAWNGGSIEVDDSALSATGTGAAALFVRGDPAAAAATGRNVALSSAAGPVVGAIGDALVTLNGAKVTGPGLWLKVGTIGDFEPLDSPAPDLSSDYPGDPLPPGALPGNPTPTVANLAITQGEITGAALTLPGSTSNLVLTDSVWNLTGSSNLTSLVNDPSRIVFSPPSGDPTLLASYKTLTVNSYSGDGTLVMNTYLGADLSPSDRLVITGGTGRGPSQIQIQRSAGEGDLTLANGILIISAIDGATTSTDAFRLGTRVIGGPYEYTLQRGGVDGTEADSWFLRSSVDCRGPNAPVPPCVLPPTPPDPPAPPGPPTPVPPFVPVPNYRPEVSLYAALSPTALNYGRSLLDSLHERVGEQELLRGRDGLDNSGSSPTGMWTRVIHVDGERDGAANGIYGSGPSYDYAFNALQIGLDLYRSTEETEHGVHVGVYGAAGGADATPDGVNGLTAGHDRIHGYTLGGYWTRYGEAARPWYIDAIFQATWYEAQAQSMFPGMSPLRTAGPGYAASLEGGYPFALSHAWMLEPQAQLDYSRLYLRGTSDAGARIHFDRNDSLVGRLSARLSREWDHNDEAAASLQSTAWGRVSIRREFLGNPRTSFSSAAGDIPFRADMGGTWWELELGLTHEVARNAFVFGNVGYAEGFDNDRRSWEGKIGLRLNW
jgi:outer membrane autotransporter protein